MGYDGYVEFDGTELFNLSRTVQLSETLGIDSVWVDPAQVAWIESAVGGADYDMVNEAPWYDAGFPASAEFAGFVPLSITGLDDSSRESSTIEYITSGGASSKPRNKTLPLVVSVALVASTSRGADFGKRWLDMRLKGSPSKMFCSGSDLRYFRVPAEDGLPVPPMAHRRNVSTTRGVTVTRKKVNHCSATWIVTFTWTANDPFEYSDEMLQFAGLGGPSLVGPGLTTSGSLAFTEQSCPVYDYSPIYDPLYPALVPAPALPNFYPEGWNLIPGVTIQRWWARVTGVEPNVLSVVPMIRLTTDVDARMVRVSIWESSAAPSVRCEPLWQAIISYLPSGLEFTIDGEQEASYAWDGASPLVRRTDSLVYGPNARPIPWSTLSDPSGFLVTLDVMSGSDDFDGDGTLRVDLGFVSKSD